MTGDRLAAELAPLLDTDRLDLARAALIVAKIEYPSLDPRQALSQLDDLGRRAADRLTALANAPILERVASLNRLLYEDERFEGNRRHYGDFRNSLLNVVIERRTGIPISLAVVYIEVARRAGLEVLGVSFPGHFLLRVPRDAGDDDGLPLVLDPFDGGRALDEDACRDLLHRHVGDDVEFDRTFLAACPPRQILSRILNNLKRTYVELRSYPHARAVTELLLTVGPAFSDLRDRGLIAYHLDDYQAALRDLEQYLRLHTWQDVDREERDRVAEHVKTLRGRVAALN